MDSTHPSPSLLPQFQQSMKPPNMGQSPTYPSPARSDSDSIRYSPDGLGLYNYTMPLSAGAPQHNSILYPPSPQPTEAWNPHVSANTSPLMPEASGESWPNVYDPPATRSPLSWNQPFSYPPPGLSEASQSPGVAGHHNFSERSSISSSNDASLYSRAGSETIFTPSVKMETPHSWINEGEVSPHNVIRQQPLTVTPDRLSNHAFGYRYGYDSPALQRYESAATTGSNVPEARNSRSAPPERRSSSNSRGSVAGASKRTRIRRNPTTPQNAQYACHICNKLFQRSYNHKAHLATHDEYREYPHKCPYPGCIRAFVRKTDLTRHGQSVHVKSKNFRCAACTANFARRDTLRRHEEDGCPRRYEIRHHELDPLRAAISRSAGSPGAAARQAYHPTDLRSATSPMDQRTPLFKEELSRL